MKNVLVLGAGMVAKPLVEYLLGSRYNVTVASNTPANAIKIIGNHPGGKSLLWEADDKELLERLIEENDLTISLLPYRFHPIVAKICIAKRRHMVTTSYVKEEMRSLNDEAIKAGVLLLNEIGLDPGIDHMSAMRIIDGIHNKGGKVEGFYSICGALPAPESAGNPFGYKFSWSPKGVILASKNSAEYLKNGKKIVLKSADLFKDRFDYMMPGVGSLEVYPNRDSISYIDIYGIPETTTMLRGTFRHRGWCEILDKMKELNLLSEEVSDYTHQSYHDFIEGLLPAGEGNLKTRLSDFLGIESGSLPIDALEWLGLFDQADMGYGTSSPFEIISDIMIRKMMLGENEKDMIVLQHLFMATYLGGKREVISSRMIDFGSPESNTSIARTVGLPAAIAADMILKKQITVTGVHIPVIPEIYNPVLNQLEKIGISMVEEYGLPESAFINN